MDDEVVATIAERCQLLNTLALSACPAVTMQPATVRALASGCGRNLRTLSVAGCLELCPHEAFPALLTRLPRLQLLDLSHCSQLQVSPLRDSFLYLCTWTLWRVCCFCSVCALLCMHV